MDTIRPTTYEAAIEAAFQLLNQKPTATLADVAKFAGIGRATLHRHFEGRDDLMAALARRALEEMDAAIDFATRDAQSHFDGLRLAMEAAIPLASRQWFLSQQAFHHDETVAASYEADQAELAREIDAAKSEGYLDKSIPTEWIVHVYDHLIYAAWEMVRQEKSTPNQAAHLAWQTFINGNGVGKDDR